MYFMLHLGQDLDLRHADPRMARGDHDLRVMPGPAAPPPMAVGGMGLGIPPVMQQQQQPPPVRPPQSMPEMDP